jgi:hypothetical protein
MEKWHDNALKSQRYGSDPRVFRKPWGLVFYQAPIDP